MKKYIGFIIILTLAHTFMYSQMAEYTSNELLVKMKPHKTSIQKANLKSQMNAHSIKTLPQTDVEVWQLDNLQDVQRVITQYRYHPDIEFVEPNYMYSIHTNDPDYDKLWGLHNTGQNGGTSDVDVDAPEAWDVTTSNSSTAVAIIDTGIDWKHEDLVRNVWQNLAEDADGDGHVIEWLNGEWAFDPGDENGIDDDGNGYVDDFIGWDFANNDNDPSDGNSHGTHVAGILGAKGDNGVGITGIAQNVELVALKYLDDEGFGYADDAVAALNYAVDMGIPISNNSWGGGGYSTPFYQALRNAEMNGHIFVAAAGNSGDNNDAFPTFPASYDVDNIISVANIDRNDALNPTSNFGINSVHIAAPGTQIWSCLPFNGYGYKSGTFMAAPLVAGACALLWSEHPERNYTEIKAAILNSATQTDALSSKCFAGGRLNVYDAFEAEILPEQESNCSYQEDSITISEVYRALIGDDAFETHFMEYPMRNWEGITLNADSCIVSIYTGDLPVEFESEDNQIPYIGYISADIVNLEELESLSLVYRTQEIGWDMWDTYNIFDGVLPEFLSSLSKLQSLTVRKLYGGLVMESGIESLGITHLDLSDCDIDDSIFPPDFTGFSNLRSLNLSHNELTQIPAFIRELDNLNTLHLNHNQLSGCYGGLAHLCTALVGASHQTISYGNNFDISWSEFCTSGMTVCNGYSECRAIDSLNLAAIYHATNGAEWTNTWNLDQPIDTWYGVSLTPAGCVNILNLADNQLSGEIPPEIGNLSKLEQLYLNNNELTGSIPVELTNLTLLNTLTLAYNQLSGCYPQGIFSLCNSLEDATNATISDGNDFSNPWSALCLASGMCIGYSEDRQRDSLALVALYHATDGPNWTNTWDLETPVDNWYGVGWSSYSDGLRYLNLSNNQLSGTIPPEIGNLEDLVYLHLNDNQLSGPIPPEIGNLEKLTSLYLNDNQLTGGLPTEIIQIENLWRLHLYNNQLGGCFDEDLKEFCPSAFHTRDIQINEGNNFDADWNTFCENRSGTCIDNTCRERDSLALVALYNQTNGESWTVNWDLNSPLNEWYGVYLNHSGCVYELKLEDKQLVGNIPPELGNLSELKKITLSRNQLTGALPPELGQLSKLERLQLSQNQLGGCFDAELLNICDAYVYFGNTPETNNFPVTWQSFCNYGYGMCGGFGACRESDSLALIEIYNQTNGENWRDAWDLQQPIDTWHGVSVSTEGCVISLDMSSDFKIIGQLPAQIGDLTELEFLNIKHTKITGNIPNEIGNLSKLKILIFSGNAQLTGNIPVSIGNLTELEELIIQGNALTGNIPESIGNLNQLKELTVNNSRLGGALPESIGNLSQLEELTIYGDSLTGALPESIGNLNQLKRWTLGRSGISGALPESIGNLSQLEELKIYNNAITGPLPSSIGHLDRLKELTIQHTSLSGALPESIGDLDQIKKLTLTHNQLSGNIPESVSRLSQLSELILNDNALSGNIPDSIGYMSQLNRLILHNNELSGTIPQSIGNMAELVYLYLYNNQLTGGIHPSIANLDRLAQFSISGNQLSGCFPEELRSAYWALIERYHHNEWLYEYGYFGYMEVNWSIDNGNGFNVSWNNFLSTGEGACDVVWPGDFNADGKVDKNDVLYWGLAEGNIGSSRASISNNWSEQSSTDWQQYVNNVNSKHQDGNGDGTVDKQDLDVLITNYRKTHTFNPQNYIASGIEYRLEPLSDTTDGGNVILRYALYAEESGAPANVHGITCSIDFGELPAGNITIDTTGSSLQPQQQVGIFDAVENRLDLALTRTDKQNKFCDGPVVVVEAIVAVKDLPSDGTFSLYVNNNGSMMEASGTVNAASGMTVYDAFSFSDTEMLLTATATHAGCSTLGEAEISITGGVAPYNIWWNIGETTHQITDLTPNKYTATVTDAIGDEKIIEVEIQGRYVPPYDADGNVLDCEIIAARIQPELCVLLEGAYNDSTALMSSSLRSLDVLPDRQPYHGYHWNYNGTEGLNWQIENYPVEMIDWLLVSFRTEPTADTQVGAVAAILMEDGCLDFINNYVSLTQNVDSLYVVVGHRNHAAVMTPQAIALTGDVLTYDFRVADSYRTATSSGQKQLSDGNWAMFAGDCNQSDINGYDINGQDKTPWELYNGIFGAYLTPDLNLDGDVNGADKALWFTNNGISSIVPK